MRSDIRCHACEKTLVLPDHGEWPVFAQITLERDGGEVVLPGSNTKVHVRDRVAIACSPTRFQRLLDDPSWKPRVLP